MPGVMLKKKSMLNLNGFEICQDSIIQHFQASKSAITIFFLNQNYCQIAMIINLMLLFDEFFFVIFFQKKKPCFECYQLLMNNKVRRPNMKWGSKMMDNLFWNWYVIHSCAKINQGTLWSKMVTSFNLYHFISLIWRAFR